MGRRVCISAALAAASLVCALPASALASSTQISTLQDDGQLLYASPQHMAQTLRTISSLGVDQVKVSVVWALVAPNPNSRRKPKFDATNPADYPLGAWDRYDMLVRMAAELGMSVYFQLSPLDPAWAAPRGQSITEGPPLGHAPTAKLFGQFVEAVGRRYSGNYSATPPAEEPPSSALGVPDGPGVTLAQSDTVPRVSYWGIWNEPNERSWLNPYIRYLPHRQISIQPALYRGLVDAAWNGLRATGHRPGQDTILVGETANEGINEPIPFIRQLYCVGLNDQPLRGGAASAVSCPASGNRAKFVASNPGLFNATGFAHHPYGWDVAPNRPYPDPAWVTLHNLGKLHRLLTRILGAYGKHPPGGAQLYLSEWGYKTNPPNPFFKTTPAKQQVWLDQGEYMTSKLPYVRELSQFLLVDDKPMAGAPKGSAAYWSTFQTGLEFSNGKPKPAFFSFRLPIWLPNSRHGAHVTVWGQIRQPQSAPGQPAELQFEPRGAHNWTNLRSITTSNPQGFYQLQAGIPSAGAVRVRWSVPSTGKTYFSRSATVT